MKKLLPHIVFAFLTSASMGQGLSCEVILGALGAPEKKQENTFVKKAFFARQNFKLADTAVRVYDWDGRILKKLNDSVRRKLVKKNYGSDEIITYQTASAEECKTIKSDLLKEGFYFLNENDTLYDTSAVLYQHQNVTSHFTVEKVDSINFYTFSFCKKSFPKPEDMYYADDLLHFTSHEYLVYYFGEQNVKKDMCFFSDNQIAKCSVLFLNTNRQVVFIWEDEVNRCKIASLLIGGQQKLKSQQDYDRYVAENNWLLKSGIHAGMSLYELRLLHGADIHFYGGNALNTGEVLANKDGKLNFKNENVILGCMNCRDNKFASASVVNADEALKDGRILFVLSIVVKPESR